MDHNECMNSAVEIFLKHGWKVSTEVGLPQGRGAVDIVATKGPHNAYFELKCTPTSLQKKKVISQLDRYKSAFGEGTYGLVCPDANGNLVFHSRDNSTGKLEKFAQG